MDINELFNPRSNAAPKAKNTSDRLVSLVSFLNTKPLVYGLEHNLVNHQFILQKDVPSVCSQRLCEDEVKLGIIPSIEYIQGKGRWKIIPDLCISSRGAVKSVNLFFKKDLTDLNKIALDTSSRTSVALLKIILKEKYHVNAEFIFMAPDLKEMLSKADAALIIGDRALHYQADNPSHLDLGEEWYDMTGLPFVYAFWAGHESGMTGKDIDAVKKSYELGKMQIEQIARDYAQDHPLPWKSYFTYLDRHISYEFGNEEEEGLMEFFRYAFFFGLIEHIPELHFYE